MKKIFVLGVSLCLLYSCGNSSKSQDEKASVDEFSAIAKEVSDTEHNAKNSLDYKGTYQGSLPSASGMGMDVVITLSDSTYIKKVSYIGKKDGAFEEKGIYLWNSQGNTITLKGSDAPNQYFVGENTLTQLDMDGKRITGELADMYILHK